MLHGMATVSRGLLSLFKHICHDTGNDADLFGATSHLVAGTFVLTAQFGSGASIIVDHFLRWCKPLLR